MTATGLKYRVEKAKRAIDEINSDTSVGWEETVEALEEVEEEVQARLEVLRDEHKGEL